MHGDADFCVSSNWSTGAREVRRAYVWEVKAPQLQVFVYDDAKRLTPTSDLVKAETQLFYYVQQLRGNPTFRLIYQLRDQDDVVPAGIIIGRASDYIRWRGDSVSFGDSQKRALAEIAEHVRDEFLYEKAGILLRTWDWVLDRLRSKMGMPVMSADTPSRAD